MNAINSLFSKNKNAKSVVSFYSRRFNMPSNITQLYLKQRIARNYDIEKDSYSSTILNRNIFISVIKYISYLLFIYIKSKRNNITTNTNSFDLLVDDIQHPHNELNRWMALESIFTKKKTVFISRATPSNKIAGIHNIFLQKNMHGYCRDEVMACSISTFISDIYFLVRQSLHSGINFIHIHTLYVNDYYYYTAVFNVVKAKYMIQDRNLGRTNAIKNYLFKKHGGRASSCVQKNIVQYNGNALFYDSDIFFSYGEKTAEDILSLGARINNVSAVGSFAMEPNVAELDRINKSYEEKVYTADVLYIGINAINSDKTNWDGYYKSVKWVSRLSNDMNNLKVCIKHHATHIGEDSRESDIICKSNVEYLDKNLNSYVCAGNSRIILTYGSSMGYELIGRGMNVIFLDVCDNPFINNFVSSEHTVQDYNSLVERVKQGIKESENHVGDKDYCQPSDDVSSQIHSNLVNYSNTI